MRRLVAAFVVAAIAVTLTACGGSSPQSSAPEASQPSATAPAPAPAPAAATQPAVAPSDASTTESADYTPLVTSGIKAPPSVTQRVRSKQPFILVFYDNAQPVTKDQKKIIAAVLKKYRGSVDLVSFDIGKYATQPSTGGPKVDKKLLKDKTAGQAIALAESLGVKFTPYVIVVDKNGYVTYRGRGLVDNGMLEREVLRVGE